MKTAIAADGAELAYRTTGDGAAIIAIPGFTGGLHSYGGVGDGLAGQYRLVWYDRRGTMRSSGSGNNGVDLRQQADDVITVLDAAGIASAAVLAPCTGAAIGFELAIRYPDRVTAVIAHEPTTLAILDDGDELIAEVREIIGRLDHDGVVPVFHRLLAAVEWPFEVGLPKALLDQVEHQIRYELLTFLTYRPDPEALLRSGVPVVAAVGTDTAPDTWHGRTPAALASLLDCRLARFPGAHRGHQECPAEYAAALASELATLAPRVFA